MIERPSDIIKIVLVIVVLSFGLALKAEETRLKGFFDKIILIMEILIIIVLVTGGWLFYKHVNKLNQDVAWLNKETQVIQTESPRNR